MATQTQPALQQLLDELGTSADGLSRSEAERRLRDQGPNETVTRTFRVKAYELARVVANPLIIILLVAGTASALLHQITDASIIIVMVLLSSGLGAFQTLRSERAVRRLQRQIAPTALVLRDHAWAEIPRRELVEGDVFRLSAGDMVPADARLIEATDLHMQQAALTGESFPAEKTATRDALASTGPESPGLVYLGTSVVSGTGIALVFATGKRSAFGDIVARLGARPEETEFERGMRHFGTLILKTVVFLVLFVLVMNISLGGDLWESLLFSVALAVGLTPEFLPMITTVTLAQGARQMAREKVIVKHLPSIQNLGSMDVLCSDKTGTLTAGTMSLDASLDPVGRRSQDVLGIAQLNSKFETGIKSPLDAAILERPAVAGEGYTKVGEVPFDFERRRTSVIVERAGRRLLVTKGAPESVFAICTGYELDGANRGLDEPARARCLECFRTSSERGFRVLAVATRDVTGQSTFSVADERELTLVGFLTFADHLIDGTADMIARLRHDGVTVKILTGDNELVSRHICEQAGLEVGRILLGSEIATMDDPALARVADQTTVFARVSPAQKHRIVRAVKAEGKHVVGFLGDGINDAPSLHSADVGISVAGAVDVAREASDIILLERRLDVLHAGILAGRRSFGNVLKYVLMGTSSNFGNVLSMAVAAVVLPFLPMLPTQILLNNFLYDVSQITIPTDRVDPLFVARPQRWNMGLVRQFMLRVGPISSVFDFLTFYVLLRVFRFGEVSFHTGWFVESLVTQTLVLYVIRTVRRPWTDRPSTPLVATTLAVVAVGFLLPVSPLASTLGFSQLPALYFGFLAVAVPLYLAIVELVKSRIVRRLHLVDEERPATRRDAMKLGIAVGPR